jgi:hypothetical protein
MYFTRNGLTIELPDTEVVSLVMERLSRNEMPASSRDDTMPRIGSEWPGQAGIYAGVMRGRDGGPDYHLIVGPKLDKTTWDKAKDEAAALVVDGCDDFSLPYRAEQALQFANVPELFEEEWYWSCEQPAEYADDAWIQDFGDGNQVCYLKSNEFRARAVRRLIIR